MIGLKHIGFFILTLTTVGVFSQGEAFVKTYGNTGYDYARDIKQDNDSGYVITGSSTSFGPDNAEAYIMKIDTAGNFKWSHNYGGSGSDWGHSIAVTIDSTYAIGGYTNSFGAGGFDFYLIRINANGTLNWEKTYGGSDWDRAFEMVEMPDSGFVLVGESYSFNDGIQSGYMVRTDKTGEVIWEHVLDRTVPTFIKDVKLDGDSLVICGGIGDGGVDTHDGYVAKFHIDGSFGWEKQIGRAYDDYFNAVYVQGGFYSLGGTRGYKFPDEQANTWMYRMSNIGEEVVDTTYINELLGMDIINDVAVREDQDYYFAGETNSLGYVEDGKADVFVGKMNPSYVFIGHGNYGEEGRDAAYAIERTRDEGVIFVGDTESDLFGTGGNNILVLKFTYLWEHNNFSDVVTSDDITTSLVDYGEATRSLVVYPNPFEDVINLPEIKDGIYSILSLDGQIMIENKKVEDQINLDYLSKGMYLIRVQTEEGLFQQRIIKH